MADVDFSFSGDASSLSRALQEIKNEVKKTRESIALLSTSFTTVYLAAQGAMQAIRATFNAVSTIPGQAARMEDLVTVFSTLMGSAENASSLIQDLWHDAANGAVSLEDMAAAAKPLTAVFSDNQSIREWVDRFADIAAGSGIAADSLAKVYARALALGSVDARAVDSLAKQGIPIYQQLAAVIGTTTAQVRAMAKAGQISADEYSAALRRMTDAGGVYYRQSSQLSETTKGSWDTLLENINRAAAALGTPINESITPVLQSIATAVEESLPSITDFSKTVVSGFSAVADIITPILSGFVSLTGALGGLKTVIASAAAALLLFASQSKAAATATVSLRGQVGNLVNALRGLSFASFTNAFKAGLVSMKGAFAATLTGMRVTWSVAWTTMAAVARTAMLTVKAALVSTGIGLIVVAIGEALGALYSWLMGNSEAAKEAAAQARQFAQSLRLIEQQASKVRTQEQYTALMEQIDQQIEELRNARAEATDNGDTDKVEQLNKQLSVLQQKKKAYKETLPLQIEEAERARQVADNIKRQQDETEALKKKIAEASDKLAELVAKQRNTERERYLGGLDNPELEIQLRLSDAGYSTLAELRAAMDELASQSHLEIGDDEQYQKLAATYNKVLELQDKSVQKEKERTKAANEYKGQTDLLEAEISGNARVVQQLREQQRIVQLTEQYRRVGLADAEARARRLVELEKQQTSNKAQTDYSQQIALLQAQIAGDNKRLQSLKAQQRITQLTEEYRSQGLANAEAKAKRLVALEQQAEQAAKDAAKAAEHGQRISDSMAQVGGGGRSVVIGGPMLSESKKHTQLLQEMGTSLKKPQTVKLSGNLKAVLGR